MGQILSWIRGPRDGQALQDVAVEEQSQPSQATPKPAAQVSTGKPAQFEKASSGSAMATKSATAGSGVTAGGSASVGTAGKGKAETVPVQVKAAVPSAAGTAAASGVAATAAVTKPQGTAKSTTATTTVKTATAAAGNVSVQGKKEAAPTQTKMQVEVPPAGAKGAKEVDPFDALASILPSVDPVAPQQPIYTGPEVQEHGIISEEGQKCGERESTLPPGYRFEDMPQLPADVKPKDVPPPLSTDEALDSLSAGFSFSENKGDVVSASSAGSNFAPSPVKTSQTPAAVPPMAAPPADKKAKMEKVSDDFSLEALLPSATAAATKAAPAVSVCPAPPSDKKDTKPKTDVGGALSLDALSDLSDMLPVDKPKPELPELRPEDIVSEDKHKKEKGVLVGERDDSIPPEYRPKEEDLKKLPAPKPEPTMGTGEALDILCGDFTTSSSAPAVKAAPPQPSADFALDALAGDFVAPTAAPTVKSACVPTETTQELSGGADNALDALSDTLKDITPVPQPAPVPTKDIVKEKEAVEEKLIKMGERDDTLPPEYRLTEEDLKKMAEAEAKGHTKPKQTMDDKTALDLLSSDFSTATEPAAPVASSTATTKLEPPVLDSEPLKPMAGPVLDSLSGTLLPDVPEFKSKTDKPKGKSKSKSKSKKHHAEDPSATDQLPAQQSSDVVPKSTRKGGKS